VACAKWHENAGNDWLVGPSAADASNIRGKAELRMWHPLTSPFPDSVLTPNTLSVCSECIQKW